MYIFWKIWDLSPFPSWALSLEPESMDSVWDLSPNTLVQPKKGSSLKSEKRLKVEPWVWVRLVQPAPGDPPWPSGYDALFSSAIACWFPEQICMCGIVEGCLWSVLLELFIEWRELLPGSWFQSRRVKPHNICSSGRNSNLGSSERPQPVSGNAFRAVHSLFSSNMAENWQ